MLFLYDFLLFHPVPQVNVLTQAHYVHLSDTVINAANAVSNWHTPHSSVHHWHIIDVYQ